MVRAKLKGKSVPSTFQEESVKTAQHENEDGNLCSVAVKTIEEDDEVKTQECQATLKDFYEPKGNVGNREDGNEPAHVE